MSTALSVLDFMGGRNTDPLALNLAGLPFQIVDNGVGKEFTVNLVPGTNIWIASGVLTAAAAATPVHVVPAASVPSGKSVYLLGFIANVRGATPWTDSTGTKVILQDTNGTPVEFYEIAKAALTASASVNMFTANVTAEAGITGGIGGTVNKGLDVVADHNFAAGSDLGLYVVGFFA